ncbi:MAG: DUF3291 domain-containing protein [Flavobacteriaceae bacterium]
MKPITTITFYSFKSNRFWAFQQMGLNPLKRNDIPGLTFFKFLGTGGGKGFSLWPDFSTYAFLGVWENKLMFENCMNHHPVLKMFNSKSQKQRTLILKSIKSHGKWNGINPFHVEESIEENHLPAVVLTRATLRWNKLFYFWCAVPKASKAIEKAKGVQFYKGIGEWPLIQQATVSIWDNFDSVQKFAYRNQDHSTIVKTTKKEKWYQEELFSRFVLLSDEINER